MKIITLKRENIYGGSLLLVNAQYSFKNQENMALAPVDDRFPEIRIESHAANMLRLILTYISSDCSRQRLPLVRGTDGDFRGFA